MLTCGQCGAVYCGVCFRQLEKKGIARLRVCRKCGAKMNKPTKLFLSDPDLGYRWDLECVGKEEEADGRAVDLLTEVKMDFFLREPSVGAYQGSKKVNLGGRGRVRCTFRNTSVKLGEKWSQVGATPGREVSDSLDPS